MSNPERTDDFGGGRDSGRPGDPRQIAEEWLPEIEKMAARVCRGHRLHREDVEDFVGHMRCKILEDDCAVVRKFQGRSSLGHYFAVVTSKAYKDWQNQRWGKWRASAEAVRLGPVAERMEVLARDGATFDELCRSLRHNFKVELSEAELAEIWERLPQRTPRRFEGEESLEGLSAPDPGPEARLLGKERRRLKGRLLEALRRARARLPPEDNLIVKLRFESGWTYANIAKHLHLEQRPFYRRVEKILGELGAALRRDGFGRDDFEELLSGDEDD